MLGAMGNLHCIKYFSRQETISGPSVSCLLNLPGTCRGRHRICTLQCWTQHMSLVRQCVLISLCCMTAGNPSWKGIQQRSAKGRSSNSGVPSCALLLLQVCRIQLRVVVLHEAEIL